MGLTATQSAAWADIDNDGYLDLFVANEHSRRSCSTTMATALLRDRSQCGIDRTAFSKGVTAADYDGDGYMDFYVTNLNGLNFSTTITEI